MKGKSFRRSRRGIVGIEAAIVMIAFVVIAAAFAFMVVNMGLTSTQRSQEAIQQGLKEASCPLTIDGSILLKSVEANDVRYVIVPLKVLGVKYVPMWTNETVVSMKVGSRTAMANMYSGINHDVDPTGMTFDEIISKLTTVNETKTWTSYGDNDVAATLSYTPIKPSSVTIILFDSSGSKVGSGSDNGMGSITIGSITIQVNYTTGLVAISGGASLGYTGCTFIAYYETIQNYATVVGEKDGLPADGTETQLSFYLDNTPVVPGSVSITLTYDSSTDTLTDNGDGTLSGDTLSGTINYTSGKVTIDFGTTAPSSASALTNYKYVVNNFAKLIVENDDGDDSLSFYEKGYLIIILDQNHNLHPRDNVLIEIRPEKSAPLSVSFTVPEAIPPNSYVTLE